MCLYKITIKPISSFCSPLQSDTFFGAFCWSYLYNYGQDALEEIIYNYKMGKPDVIFSNAFPEGYLPAPVSLRDLKNSADQPLNKLEKYRNYIDSKKREHLVNIPLKDFNKLLNGQEELSYKESEPGMTVMSWRNMVCRDLDCVQKKEDRSNLFEIEEMYERSNFDIYIYSTLDKNVLTLTLEQMFRNGIGAQRSVGKGAFSLIKKPEVFTGFDLPNITNAFIALSNFIPRKADPTDGVYQMFVKYPKVSYISSDQDSPFKKPLIFMKAGSCFFTQESRPFYGSCVSKIALKNGRISDDIVIGAYTVAIPCFLKNKPDMI